MFLSHSLYRAASGPQGHLEAHCEMKSVCESVSVCNSLKRWATTRKLTIQDGSNSRLSAKDTEHGAERRRWDEPEDTEECLEDEPTRPALSPAPSETNQTGKPPFVLRIHTQTHTSPEHTRPLPGLSSCTMISTVNLYVV